MKSILITLLISTLIVLIFFLGIHNHHNSKVYSIKSHYPIKDHDAFYVLAHRGGAHEWPENTLLAFEKTSKISNKIILEFDVHLTKDNIPIVIHDSTLDRTTNGNGKVTDFTLSEIKKLDAAHFFNPKDNFPFRGKGIKVPTLEEVFKKFPKTLMAIEIKPNNRDTPAHVMKLVDKYQNHTHLWLASAHKPVIKYLQEKRPHWFYGASQAQVLQTVILERMGLTPLNPMNFDAFFVPTRAQGISILSKKFIDEAQKRKKSLFIWTINDEDEFKSLRELNVTGIVTDRPGHFYQKLKSEIE